MLGSLIVLFIVFTPILFSILLARYLGNRLDGRDKWSITIDCSGKKPLLIHNGEKFEMDDQDTIAMSKYLPIPRELVNL